MARPRGADGSEDDRLRETSNSLLHYQFAADHGVVVDVYRRGERLANLAASFEGGSSRFEKKHWRALGVFPGPVVDALSAFCTSPDNSLASLLNLAHTSWTDCRLLDHADELRHRFPELSVVARKGSPLAGLSAPTEQIARDVAHVDFHAVTSHRDWLEQLKRLDIARVSSTTLDGLLPMLSRGLSFDASDTQRLVLLERTASLLGRCLALHEDTEVRRGLATQALEGLEV